MRCPNSRFPIGIIVFDEIELMLYVSQGLTLSIASLVMTINIKICVDFAASRNIYSVANEPFCLIIGLFVKGIQILQLCHYLGFNSSYGRESFPSCSRGNLHLRGFKNRRHGAHHDFWAVHGLHVGGNKVQMKNIGRKNWNIFSRILINNNSSGWGHAGHFMASTNYLAEMWLPDIQVIQINSR